MKIAFFGTPEFAGNILSGILEYSEIEIALVVSQADKAVGRKRELQITPVKQVALDANIEVMQPEKLKSFSGKGKEAVVNFREYLKSLDLDFIVVVAYGKIIPQEILDIPKYGCINIHGSLLPKYRGASPVQAAIKSGEIETGLTTMYMSKGMDEGDMLLKAKVNIDIIDTSPDIFKKFVQVGPELLLKTLEIIVSGKLKLVPQDVSQATYCGKINREDGEVFFQKQSSREIYDTYRAYTPWPGIFSFYEGKRFVFEEIELSEKTAPGFEAGRIIKNGKQIGIVCNDGKMLGVKQVKLEGKKSMDILSFMNGNKDFLNYKFK